MDNADIVILAILALSILFGLWRGFVAEVLSLVCWVAAFWVAWMFGDAVAGWYGQWLHQPVARIIAGYLTCFLGVLVVGALLGWLLRKLIRGTGLSGPDRMLGMMFGLVRGVLLIFVIVLVIDLTPMAAAPWWQHSQLVPQFSQGAGWLSAQLPPEASRYMQSGEEALQTARKTLPTVPGAPISLPHRASSGAIAPLRKRAPDAKPTSHRPDGDVGQ